METHLEKPHTQDDENHFTISVISVEVTMFMRKRESKNKKTNPLFIGRLVIVICIMDNT